jgi:hypothetical protein
MVARGLGKGVQRSPVGGQLDHDRSVVTGHVAREQVRVAAQVGVQRPVGEVVARVVPPLIRLARAGAEDLDAHVGRVPHQEPSVREHGDGLPLFELARPLSAPPERLDMGPGRVEYAHFLRLGVQYVDGLVIVHRDRGDVAEEVFLRSFQFADRHLRHQRGHAAPRALRPAVNHGCVADGFDGVGGRGTVVGAAGGQRDGGQGEDDGSRRQWVGPPAVDLG